MGQDLKNWDPEDPAQWESTGKKIANRNLWISIPCLLCGFAVWLYWGDYHRSDGEPRVSHREG